MVAAGGGGAEWKASIGGNAGGISGGESASSIFNTASVTFDEKCPGATQTGGSNCQPLPASVENSSKEFPATPGTFGSAGKTEPYIHASGNEDYGGYGGGEYYGGTSYQYAFSGSGGSSFISGYEGCKAVKERSDVIDHTNTSYHYSGFIFTNTEMISGNETMPVPSSSTEEGIHSGEGAFRITILMYHYHCTYKRSLFPSLIPNLFIFIFSPINRS